jgi:IclR family transcriptional regulator, acetate operon repressor
MVNYVHVYETYGAGRSVDTRRIQPVKSADRVVDILELLAEDPQGLTVSQISARLGIARSSAHGLVHTLRRRGYLTLGGGAPKRLQLGARLIQLGLNVSDRLELRSAARPTLERLVADTNDTALLVVPDRGELLYVDKIVSDSSDVRTDPRMSARRPLHSTSLGKALLAAVDDASARAVLGRVGTPPVTNFTIADQGALLADLAKTRRRGYAVDHQEAFLGVCCVGAPIRDHTGRPIGSISLSTIREFFVPERTGPSVIAAAVEISHAMGWKGDSATLYKPAEGSIEALLGSEGSSGWSDQAMGPTSAGQTAGARARAGERSRK